MCKCRAKGKQKHQSVFRFFRPRSFDNHTTVQQITFGYIETSLCRIVFYNQYIYFSSLPLLPQYKDISYKVKIIYIDTNTITITNRTGLNIFLIINIKLFKVKYELKVVVRETNNNQIHWSSSFTFLDLISNLISSVP